MKNINIITIALFTSLLFANADDGSEISDCSTSEIKKTLVKKFNKKFGTSQHRYNSGYQHLWDRPGSPRYVNKDLGPYLIVASDVEVWPMERYDGTIFYMVRVFYPHGAFDGQFSQRWELFGDCDGGSFRIYEGTAKGKVWTKQYGREISLD